MFVLWSYAVAVAGVCGCAAASGRAHRFAVCLSVGELGNPALMYADEEGGVGACLRERLEELRRGVMA